MGVPDVPAERLKANIAGFSGGSVTVDQLLIADIIEVNDTVIVISYDFKTTNGSITSKMSIQGNSLGVGMKQYIMALRPGQIAQFKNILCKDKNGLMFRLPNMQFTIARGR